jgi:hypothetical protein
MTQIFVRPANGLVLRLPDGAGTLPAEGMEVERSLFWDRRIADGDVLVGSPHATAAKKKEA